jgi:hypothetical protein
MAGDSFLRCEGFIEGDGYAQSKAELTKKHRLSDREVDDRLNALLWALRREPAAVADRIGEKDFWVAVTPRGSPGLRVFLRPRPGVITECELVWIEARNEPD